MSVQERMNAYWSRWADEYDAQQTARLRSEDARRTWRDVWERALAPAATRPEVPREAPAPAAAPRKAAAEVAVPVARTGPPRVLDVLDVGTGSGNVALQVAELGHRVTGIDLAPGMLERARAKATGGRVPIADERAATSVSHFATADLRFLPGDAVAPPFATGSFDAIVSRYVLWTLRDAGAALAAWRDLLRPGGIIAAVDSAWFPAGQDLGEGLAGERQADFRHAYGDGTLEDLPLAAGREDQVLSALESSGFTQVTVTPLQEVLDLDRRQGVAPGHHPQLQMLYRAMRT
ncbi:class I SAM-dependent methyltransferase [Brachybacterium subflavum]|uniref:class I SAM-dependent methyltransferase n=1 Tax=Brachybacterium subflavum TaxID=2585206 RepID=UPI001D0CE734|nr:class I SAM-dependent methyltransferase [Brachybacterium subflavum]